MANTIEDDTDNFNHHNIVKKKRQCSDEENKDITAAENEYNNENNTSEQRQTAEAKLIKLKTSYNCKTIDCSEINKYFSKKTTLKEHLLTWAQMLLEKIDIFKIFKEQLLKKNKINHPCLDETQKKTIIKKQVIYKTASNFIIQAILMSVCLFHLFFINKFYPENPLIKLMAAFLILYNWSYYLLLLIIIFYFNKISMANELYTNIIYKNIIFPLRQIFLALPIFDTYHIFNSKNMDNPFSKQLFKILVECPK